MKCPSCKTPVSRGTKCPVCNVDIVLFRDTVRLSDKLFNQGLERLKAGDFFHGIKFLQKSIVVNKSNVQARNLLGLALFEVGHIGEALKHWVISKSLPFSGENPSEGYLDTAHKNARRLESLSDAVEMYNQALGHIKQKSDDLAIIQLKKAIEINPKFVDALNLLTLCYLIQNDRERATATAERVIAFDVVNPVALNYYAILNPGRTRPSRTARPRTGTSQPQVKGPYKPLGLEEKKERNFHFAELLTFLIGVGVTVAAAYFLLVPAFDNAREAERNDAQIVLAEAREEYRSRLDDAEEARQNLIAQISERDTTIYDLRGDLSRERRVNEVNHAYFLFQGGELRVAVDLLEHFDTEGLTGDITDRVEEIFAYAYPALGMQYYTEGLAAFNLAHRDTYRAMRSLEDALRFLDAARFLDPDYEGEETTEQRNRHNRLFYTLGVLYYDDDRTDPYNELAYEFLSALYRRAPGLPAAFATPAFNFQERTTFNNMMASIEAQR